MSEALRCVISQAAENQPRLDPTLYCRESERTRATHFINFQRSLNASGSAIAPHSLLYLYMLCLPSTKHLAMKTVSIQLPESVFSALRKDPDEFAREMRIAAAVKWYEIGEISQGKAAEIAGLNRAEFINILARYQVSPFQYNTQELAEEIADLDEENCD